MAKYSEIEEFLNKKGLNFKVINLPEVAVSFADVVRLSNGQIKIEEIIKTLLFKIEDGFIAAVLEGPKRADMEKLKNLVNVQRLATKDEVKEVVGVDPGAVCPILIGVLVIIDQDVAQLERVNMGSGDHLKGLEMNFTDLLQVLPEYRIEKIS